MLWCVLGAQRGPEEMENKNKGSNQLATQVELENDS